MRSYFIENEVNKKMDAVIMIRCIISNIKFFAILSDAHKFLLPVFFSFLKNIIFKIHIMNESRIYCQ